MTKIYILGVLTLATAAAPALSQVTTYTTRAAFTTAGGLFGPLSTETFNGYSSDTQFRTGPVDVGAFSLVGSGGRQDDRNYIDASPLAFSGFFAVNGTSYVQGQVGGFADGTSSFVIQFDAPIFAFGADFANLNDIAGITRITVNGVVLTPGSNASFFGFTSTTAFTSILFSSSNPAGPNSIDNFGMDNVTYTAAQVAGVPEPATWTMMLIGFGAIGFGMRRRNVTTQVRYA